MDDRAPDAPASDDRAPRASGDRALDERALLAAVRGSDHAAFEALFRAHYATLVAVAEGLLRERDAAEEVVQDVLFGVWRGRETLYVEGPLGGYLYRATRNRALNRLRHARVVRHAAPALAATAAPPRDPHALLAESELRAAVQRAVEALPERCRAVFELSRVAGLPYAEIARSLDVSVKTVETQMGRALRSLRARLRLHVER